jgi:hypothetical protein
LVSAIVRRFKISNGPNLRTVRDTKCVRHYLDSVGVLLSGHVISDPWRVIASNWNRVALVQRWFEITTGCARKQNVNMKPKSVF